MATITSTTVSGDTLQTGFGPMPNPATDPLGYATSLKTLYYFPGENYCSAFHCGSGTDVRFCTSGDITIAQKSCAPTCPDQPTCSRLNPATCPTFSSGAVTGSAAWTAIPGTQSTSLQKSVTCTYNTSDIISSTANVASWNTTFGANDSYNNTIMPDFCTQSSSNCPLYPTIAGAPVDSTLLTLTPTGSVAPIGTPASCSNFVDTGTAGQLCRAWATANPDLANTAYQNYCLNSNTPDCSCVNRALNSAYESIKSTLGDTVNAFNDGCWYAPCASSGLYLIPSDINSSNDCETQVCQQLQNIINNTGTVNIGDVSENINCQFTTPTNNTNDNSASSNCTGINGSFVDTGSCNGNGSGGTNNTNNTNNNNTNNNNTDNTDGTSGSSSTSSFWSKYKWVIIGVIIVVLVIVVIFVVMSSRHKKPVSKDEVKAKEEKDKKSKHQSITDSISKKIGEITGDSS